MSARDQILLALANVTPDRYVDADHLEQALGPWADLAERAGLRPPARTVSTAEELEALPEGTVVRSAAGTIASLEHGQAFLFGSGGSVPRRLLELPLIVLFEVGVR